MFRWLRGFVRRELVTDVPPDMDFCLNCGKLVCSEGEFKDCARRKEHAAQIAAALSAPDAADDGRAQKG
jgi:hypothetical protein